MFYDYYLDGENLDKMTMETGRELTMSEVDGTYMVLSSPVTEFDSLIQVRSLTTLVMRIMTLMTTIKKMTH